MKLRFVTCSDPESAAIRAREGAMAPWVKFTPSHVEMVVADGYLGAHADGGVAIRPVGYDKLTLTHELFLDIGGDDKAAELYARSKIGAPYDWGAIFDFVDFVLPIDLHEKGHLICSAFMTITGRKADALPFRLARLAHEISPADLLLVCSGRVAIAAA
jgi:hypothetical protein